MDDGGDREEFLVPEDDAQRRVAQEHHQGVRGAIPFALRGSGGSASSVLQCLSSSTRVTQAARASVAAKRPVERSDRRRANVCARCPMKRSCGCSRSCLTSAAGGAVRGPRRVDPARQQDRSSGIGTDARVMPYQQHALEGLCRLYKSRGLLLRSRRALEPGHHWPQIRRFHRDQSLGETDGDDQPSDRHGK